MGAMLVINLGLVGLLLWITDLTSRLGLFVVPGGFPNLAGMVFLWGVIVLSINRRLWAAVMSPEPANIQRAIGTSLLSIIMIDAMLILFKLGMPGLPFAIGTLALLAPAMLLKRWIPLT